MMACMSMGIRSLLTQSGPGLPPALISMSASSSRGDPANRELVSASSNAAKRVRNTSMCGRMKLPAKAARQDTRTGPAATSPWIVRQASEMSCRARLTTSARRSACSVG